MCRVTKSTEEFFYEQKQNSQRIIQLIREPPRKLLQIPKSQKIVACAHYVLFLCRYCSGSLVEARSELASIKENFVVLLISCLYVLLCCCHLRAPCFLGFLVCVCHWKKNKINKEQKRKERRAKLDFWR